MSANYDMLTIVGPTATGKTGVAVAIARELGAEILSGDSRQIYRAMTLGTGKDLSDYTEGGPPVPYHLIDIANPGEKYSIFSFQHDFLRAYRDICARGRLPMLVGGSGLYVESVLQGYRMTPVPQNEALRESLRGKTLEELTVILKSYGKKLHNTTDTDTPRRAIRAIEIEDYYKSHPVEEEEFPRIRSLNFCLTLPREMRWERIRRRLDERLEAGMADEIRALLGLPSPVTLPEGVKAITPEQLMYYGLEYKYITLYVLGRMSLEEMREELYIAIRQFAKRQMTWFRGMERRGIPLIYIDASRPATDTASEILHIWRERT